MRRWVRWMASLFWRRRDFERELSEELQFHLEARTAALVQRGLSPADARRRARIEFGSIQSHREQSREAGGLRWLDDLRLDTRQAIRSLRRTPAFFMLVVLILAIGIGITTAVFTIADQVLFRPPAYLHGERLMQVVGVNGPNGGGGNNLNAHRLLGWRSQPLFEAVEGMAPQQLFLGGEGEPERISGMLVTTGWFQMLGVAPQLGRTFSDADGRPASERVAVISDGLWKRRFGSARDVIGRTLVLNDEPTRIVGVMPRSFFRERPQTIWTPYELRSHDGDTAVTNFIGYGRLPGGIARPTAQSRADDIAVRLQDADPQPRTWYITLRNLKMIYFSDNAHTTLLVLLGAVGFVLLIACANVASLLMARGLSRERETVVRSAIGASRGRLVRQGLTEGGVLAAAGGVLGIGLAWFIVRAMLAAAPSEGMFIDFEAADFAIDGRVMAFAALITSATSLLFGVLPAWRASTPSANPSKGTAAGTVRSPRRLSGGLVVTEVALSLVLLVGAALMIRTFVNMSVLDPGFDPRGVAMVEIGLPVDRYPTPTARQEFFDALVANVSTLPDVVAAGIGDSVPPTATGFSIGVTGETGGLTDGSGTPQMVGHLQTSEGYFGALGIPIVVGRAFTNRDLDDSVVVSESIVRRLWPAGSPIGQRIRTSETDPWNTVIGVARDIETWVGDTHLIGQMYFPMFGKPIAPSPANPPSPAGSARTPTGRRPTITRWLVVRSTNPAALLPSIKSAVWSLDRTLPLPRVDMVERLWTEIRAPQRFAALTMSVLALVAVVLASTGLFAGIAHVVARRTHEIGIRMALGASARSVVRLVVSQSAAAVTTGLLIGLAAAAALTRYLQVLLFQVDPLDPALFLAATVAFLIVAVLAAFIPARRATRVDPLIALRCD